MSMWAKPVRPCVPMTIRSAFRLLALSTIDCAAAPVFCSVRTVALS